MVSVGEADPPADAARFRIRSCDVDLSIFKGLDFLYGKYKCLTKG